MPPVGDPDARGHTDLAAPADVRPASDAAPPTDTSPPVDAPPALVPGLKAAYYLGQTFRTLFATRIDPNIDFDWGAEPAVAGFETNDFAVRWTGKIVPTTSATYTFTTLSDDGMRVFIDGVLVIDAWVLQSSVEHTGTAELRAGVHHDLKVEYFDNNYTARARLFWSAPSLPREIVPRARLFTAP